MADSQYNSEDQKADKARSSEALRIARERFNLAEEAYHDIRKEAADDIKFRAGQQWPDDMKAQRDLKRRPSLVINRIPGYIRQITNDQRQNRPSIKVFPVDDKADPKTAKIYQGMIRHIEYNSGADAAYDTALQNAATGGFGFMRVITDYVDPMSFDQEILIKRILDPFSVYFDPNSKEPDGSDANWAFVFEDVPKDTYKAEYKDTGLAHTSDWDSLGRMIPGWVTQSTCRVAEYFYKEFKEVDIYLMPDGQVVTAEALHQAGIPSQGLPKRRSNVPVIKWCKINGNEVIEETEWPGRWIPIIPVYGDEFIVDGKRVLEGIVRHAKDPARMYNYWASCETEAIALAPKAPYIAAEGQIPPEYQHLWETANQDPHSYLPYRPVALNGQPVPPPQRNAYEPPVMAITNARNLSSEDIKATTGIWDAAIGAKSNETSGIAIQRRNMQSQTANYHLIDNLTRSIRHLGKILVDLIPHVYDTARAARIIGEDDQQEIVLINQEFQHKGEFVTYDMNKGKFDVVVETGPAFATKRQEAAATMIEITKANPQIMQAAGDLMVKNMDWPGATEVADRLRKMLPPGLAEDKDKKPVPPEVVAQMQQQSQIIEQLTQQLNVATEEIKTKKYELDSKERIETMKLETQAAIELAKLESGEAVVALKTQVAELDQRTKFLNQFGQGSAMETPFSNEFNGGAPEQALPNEIEQQPPGGLEPGPNMEG